MKYVVPGVLIAIAVISLSLARIFGRRADGGRRRRTDAEVAEAYARGGSHVSAWIYPPPALRDLRISALCGFIGWLALVALYFVL